MTCPDKIECTFNANIVLGEGNINLFKGSSLIGSFSAEDITVSGSHLEVDISCIATGYGTYQIEIEDGLVSSEDGEKFGYFTWNFDIIANEYDPTEYSNEYLT